MSQIGYAFQDTSLLTEALTHKSLGKPHNERLEFLGDAILSFVIAEALFERFTDISEGDMSHLRSKLVKKETLAEVARSLSLEEHLMLGQSELKSGGYLRDSILSNALEAIIAAIYLDSDTQTMRAVVVAWFADCLSAIDPHRIVKDPKTQLQEYLQSNGQPRPRYLIEEVKGLQHAQEFHVQCLLEELNMSAIGVGSTRKLAEQAAATQLLALLIK